MVKVGIIGCGSISRFHHEGYKRAGAQVAHVCDIDEQAAGAVADKYGSRISSDYRALLDDPNVDLVSVTTGSGLHKEICLAAIAAGKGVVCEKTLTTSAEDSAEVARAAEKAGTFFATAYMKRFFPAVRQAKEMLSEMGDIISVYARSWQPFHDLWAAPLPEEFAQHPSRLRLMVGGGVLKAGGSHILDLLHWFVGRPNRLCGQMFTREGMDFEIQANSMMWLPRGGVIHFECCWHPLRFAGYEKNGWDERFEINTSKGRLSLYTVTWTKSHELGAFLVHEDAETGRTTEYRYPPVNTFDAEMAEMLRRFEAGEPGFPSARDGYVVDEIIEHIESAAAQRSVLPVKWRI